MQKKIHNFLVLLEKDTSGWIVAKVPELQGCYTQGKTVDEALKRIKEAIQVCLEAEKIDLPDTQFIGLQQVEVKI